VPGDREAVVAHFRGVLGRVPGAVARDSAVLAPASDHPLGVALARAAACSVRDRLLHLIHRNCGVHAVQATDQRKPSLVLLPSRQIKTPVRKDEMRSTRPDQFKPGDCLFPGLKRCLDPDR
jgi:hypothetical protein